MSTINFNLALLNHLLLNHQQPETALLGKRPNQVFNFSLQDSPYKKIKDCSLTVPPSQYNAPDQVMDTLTEILSDIKIQNKINYMKFILKMKQLKQQGLIQDETQFNALVQRHKTKTSFNNKILLKQILEKKDILGKEKMFPKLFKNKEKTHTDSKNSIIDLTETNETNVKLEAGSESFEEVNVVPFTEPVLIEYTKNFPEWDLATIFGFLGSGQSKTSFEKEKEFRQERKKRKAQRKKELAVMKNE